MPTEESWTTYFEPEQTLGLLGIDHTVGDLVDIGCGYGTFLIPAAGLIAGTAIGVDIDPQMIAACREKADKLRRANVLLLTGDIDSPEVAHGLADHRGRADRVTLFNILHCQEPIRLLQHATDLLTPSGAVAVIHWKHQDTPRGPAMDIRPTPDQITEWAAQVGLSPAKHVDLPPYHFGLLLVRPPC